MFRWAGDGLFESRAWEWGEAGDALSGLMNGLVDELTGRCPGGTS